MGKNLSEETITYSSFKTYKYYKKETNLFYYLSYSHQCVWTGRQRAKPADDF